MHFAAASSPIDKHFPPTMSRFSTSSQDDDDDDEYHSDDDDEYHSDDDDEYHSDDDEYHSDDDDDEYHSDDDDDEDNAWTSEAASDDEPLPIEERLDEAIFYDDKEEFLHTIHQDASLFQRRGQKILKKVCNHCSFDCVEALLKGDTPVVFNINEGDRHGMFPIHSAAKTCDPSFTELFLIHGAQADVRCGADHYLYKSRLPLFVPLYAMSCDDSIEEWTFQDSIFKLVTLVCLPRFQNHLETAGLLAWNTKDKEIEEEFLHYARAGMPELIAALLVVGHKRLNHLMQTIVGSQLSLDSNLTISDDEKEAIFFLLEVFMRAGDAIETYVKQDKDGISIQQTSKEIAGLLQDCGFSLKRADTDLTGCTWFHLQDFDKPEWREKPKDRLIPHYGNSHYRWTTYVKPRKRRRLLGKIVINQQRIGEKDDEPLSLEEKLEKALVNDDKEEFLSTLRQDTSLFQLRGQEILVKACAYRALECVEVLVKGESPVIVSINGQAPDKMFLIHHAAKTCRPSIIELFLYYGARADALANVRCVCGGESYQPRLSLSIPLHKIGDAIGEWTPRDCMLKLVTLVCLPRFQNHLESAWLLAWSIEKREIEREVVQLAKDRKLVHIAALLLVSHKKFCDCSETVFELICSVDSYGPFPKDIITAIRSLLEVFLEAGDAIEAYVKQGKIGVTMHQTVKEVECLLKEAGVSLESADLSSTIDELHHIKREWRWKPEDSNMPHYGESGYRWMTYGKPSQPCRILGKTDINQQKIGKKCFHAYARVDAAAKCNVSEGFPSTTSCFLSEAIALTKATCKSACPGRSWSLSPKEAWPLLAFARRGIFKYMIVK